MSNGARHALGALTGAVLTVVTFALLILATDRAARIYRYLDFRSTDKALVIALLVAVGLLLGLAAGSRLSPLASLVPGAFFTFIGLLSVLSTRDAARIGHDLLHVGRFQLAYVTLATTGVPLVLGALLVVASLPPSRWRGRRAAAHTPVGRHRPAGQRPAPADAPRPFGAPYGGPQSAPPSAPPSRPDAQYGRPPAAPNPPNPPAARRDAPRPAGGDDDEPGEWTRMYGGGR